MKARHRKQTERLRRRLPRRYGDRLEILRPRLSRKFIRKILLMDERAERKWRRVRHDRKRLIEMMARLGHLGKYE